MPDGLRETTDPDGRQVVFDERTQAHLARRRPQMLRHAPAVQSAISRPDAREDHPAPGRERLYRRDRRSWPPETASWSDSLRSTGAVPSFCGFRRAAAGAASTGAQPALTRFRH